MFPNVPFVVIENYNNDREAEVDSIGLNTQVLVQRQLERGSGPELVEGRTHDLRLESTAGLGTMNDPDAAAADGKCFIHHRVRRHHEFHADARTTAITASVFLTDPGGWGGGPSRSGFVGAPDISDEIKAIRLSATRKFETLSS